MDRVNSYKLPGIRHIATLGFYGYNFKEFLVVGEDADNYSFYHIPTGRIISVRR